MVLHSSLSDSKSPQVSRIFLSILVDLDNAVFWMVSTCPLISKFTSSVINPLEIEMSAPITIGITFTFNIIVFLALKQGLGTYLIFLFSFDFTLWSAGTAKSSIR